MKKIFIVFVLCIVAYPLLFLLTDEVLRSISFMFSTSYEAINIIVYYILLPLCFVVIVFLKAKNIGYLWAKVCSACLFLFYVYMISGFIGINFMSYSKDLYSLSDILLIALPLSYKLNSVIVCVVIPLIVIFLGFFNRPIFRKQSVDFVVLCIIVGGILFSLSFLKNMAVTYFQNKNYTIDSVQH